MAHTTIHSGVCGFVTEVQATPDEDGRHVHLQITSTCPAVTRIAPELETVDAFQEFSFRGAGPRTLELARKLSHPACPVPAGIIKAIEVAAGLALPADVTIEVKAE